MLGLQDERGYWGTEDYGPTGTETVPTLDLLRLLGLDPASKEARTAVSLLRDHVWSEFGSMPFFAGEVEPCINGRILALAGYFGELGAGSERLVNRLIGEQLEDGGWNCQAPDHSRRSSFHTTLCALRVLRWYDRTVP